MRWSEVAPDLSVWTLPGRRMKTGKPHVVHLPEAAREVLRAIPRHAGVDLVFTTTTKRLVALRSSAPDGKRRKSVPTPISGFSQAKRYLDAAIANARAEAASELGQKPKPMPSWRVHDLRRTGVTTLAALGFDSIMVDKLLAHQAARLRGTAAVYQRHEFLAERAKALDVWTAHVMGSAEENVVQLVRA
jgi:integrase